MALTFVSHSSMQVLDMALHRGKEICDHLIHPCFGLWREFDLYIFRSENLAECAVGRRDATLPTWLLLFSSGKNAALEIECFIDERLRKVLAQVDDHPI